MGKKTTCWEFRDCGMGKEGLCPAYPNGGRVCYLVAGTKCNGQTQGAYAQKLDSCRDCDFYRALVVIKSI